MKRTKTVIKEIHQDGRKIDTTVETEFKTVVTTENFFMVFFESMRGFLGLKRIADMRVIACMCAIADFDTGRVLLTKQVREKLCKDSSIQYSNLSRSLKNLSDAGLITGGKGTYHINPNIFWKGTTKSRTEVLRTGGLSFKVTLYGKDIDTVTELEPSSYLDYE